MSEESRKAYWDSVHRIIGADEGDPIVAELLRKIERGDMTPEGARKDAEARLRRAVAQKRKAERRCTVCDYVVRRLDEKLR